MAAKNITFEALQTAIKNRQFSPVYVIHGEEGYFSDALVKQFESILTDDEKEFNFTSLYAPRVDISQLPAICHRIPMMSDFQVVILKEAQAVASNQLNILVKYLSSPSPSTILVVAARGAQLKGDFMSAAKKSEHVVVFESKKIYDNQLPQYISEFVKTKNLNISPVALNMLSEYVGPDLGRLYNETNKLIDILGPGATITPEAIEKHIGFSRTFNAFELVDALACKDVKKAYQIANYLRSEPKGVSIEMAIGSIFSFFSDLLTTYFLKDRSERGVMGALGIKWPVQYRKFANGQKSYNAFQVIEIIRAIRSFDRHSKGAGSRRDKHDLFQELIHHILTAPGNLFPQF